MSSAAEGGNEEAAANLATYLMEGNGTKNDEGEAVDMLHRSCARGGARASMWLSLYYKRGLGVQKDEEKEKQLLVLAQKRGIVGEWVKNEKGNWEISVK